MTRKLQNLRRKFNSQLTPILDKGLVKRKHEKEALADVAMRLLQSEWFTVGWVAEIFGYKTMPGLFTARVTVVQSINSGTMSMSLVQRSSSFVFSVSQVEQVQRVLLHLVAREATGTGANVSFMTDLGQVQTS